MIIILLLLVIYLAFISLGLPDSVLGVSLPAMSPEWLLSLSDGSLVSAVIVGCTVISSFASGHIIKKLGAGRITFISCVITASALLGISWAPAYGWLLAFAVPLGLGAGAVDAALNNYVALHFKAKHMNWLHSFWGVGATLGPIIMTFSITQTDSWRAGYRSIALIQFGLSLILFLTLPLWKKVPATHREDEGGTEKTKSKENPFRLKGVNYAFAVMALYCAVEAGLGLWGSSFLVRSRGFSIERAAFWIALYYGGITAGRFVSGFISIRFNNVQMIRGGMLLAIGGLVLLLVPGISFLSGLALVLIGLGLAPVFPSMLHETPVRFGRNSSQILVGYQMGFAYLGNTFLSPLAGVFLQYTSASLLPGAMLLLAVSMLFCSERLIALTTHE
ncbi:MFS transporter [Pontiella sulfatireligans]|uniref:Major facilitator superfamily (MFS) profile domain-containing protein n=1 Tax=Pontiella sulfatireligans TaxID=2750658 RepID=A0A6C2UVG7_9BACT|nr:MFS transporter [Pontiella sulfatireligans]VGO23391.1 hypothetical protein SCARR_05498 [Pontiella sulfatireligans]